MTQLSPLNNIPNKPRKSAGLWKRFALYAIMAASTFTLSSTIYAAAADAPSPAMETAAIEQTKDLHQAFPAIYDGTMMPYDFSKCTPAEVPDSLTPIFISYVGRHGARFLSSEKKIKKLEDAISKSKATGNLTPLGEEFATLVELVKKNTDGRWGALDSVGISEQQRLATQMADMWPGITKDGSIHATATYVPRVIMSMYEFSHTLATLHPDLDIYTAEGHRFDSLLRYFSTNPEYVDYLKQQPWKSEYDRFVDTSVSPRPAINIFGSTFDDKESRKLTLDIYAVLQSLRAAGLPAPDTRWMTLEEYQNCWAAANLEHYFARTDTPVSSIPVEAATPLLIRLLNNLSSAAAGDSQDVATLYFGHAETLMPLLSLCDVEGCNAPEATVNSGSGPNPSEANLNAVASQWKDYDVVPLGANFEIVLLKGPSGLLYALTRLNGHDVKISDFPTPLIPWQTLKSFWTTRIERFTTQYHKDTQNQLLQLFQNKAQP